MEDWQLLRNYTEKGSDDAFRELMVRHLDLVYASALRQLGDSHSAQDIAQSTFCLLAQKASQLNPNVSLVGWLYKTAYYLASRYRESELRRQRREQEATYMTMDNDTRNLRWEQIAPVLDEAMNRLSDNDRTLLLLRFFKGIPFQEVGRTIGVSEDAARMRINRALEKLRELLGQSGIVSTATALAAILSQKAAEAAPINISQSIQKTVIGAMASANAPAFIGSTQFYLKTMNIKKIFLSPSAIIFVLVATVYLAYLTQETHTYRDAMPTQHTKNLSHQAASLLSRAARMRATAPVNTPRKRAAIAEPEEAPAQVHIQVKYFQITASDAQSNPLLISDNPRISVLTDEQTQNLTAELERAAGGDRVWNPNVTTINGRHAQLAETITRSILFTRPHMETKSNPYGNLMVSEITYEPSGSTFEVTNTVIETGRKFDVIPYLQANNNIQLVFLASRIEFLGYQKPFNSDNPLEVQAPIPSLCFLQATNSVLLESGQSAIYGPFYYDTRVLQPTPSSQEIVNDSNGEEPNNSTDLAANAAPLERLRPIVKQAIYIIFSATVVDKFDNSASNAFNASGE